MKTVKIKFEKRDKLGKKETRRLRNQGLVPCVMYGGEENLHFVGSEIELKKIIFSPDVQLIEIDLGDETKKGLIKDIQFHPVTDSIIHIDFIEVTENKPVIATLPLTLEGSSIGVRNGGKLRQRRRYLKVKGLVKDFPDKLTIDISKLDIGQTMLIGDLNYTNLEILDPKQSMVISVVSSRVAMKSMTIEEPEAEDAAFSTEVEGEEASGEEKSE